MRKPGPFEEAQIMAALVRHRFYMKGDERGALADLSFRNLSNLDLSKQSLVNVIFRGSNLGGANLSECDLSGADFFGADLEGADLHGAILVGADFRGANLSRAILSYCQLQGSDFSARGGDSGKESARLTEVKLDHALLCQANLNGCDMSGAELVDADLSGADLSKAVLIGAELSGATLDNVKLSDTVLELSRLSESQQSQIVSTGGIVARSYNDIPASAVLLAVDKHSEWIKSGGSSGKRMDFEGCLISGCSLRKSNLAGARLRRCSLNGLDLSEAILDMSDMTYCDLTHANLSNASLKGTTLRGANLAHANMAGARVDTMTFKGTKSWPANLDGAILQHADLTNTLFDHTIMSHADLRDCILSGANFIEVDLAKVKMSPRNTSSSASCKRASQRYTDPRLFVKTEYGVFPTLNWSLSGICLSYSGNARFVSDADIHVSLVAEGTPPPRKAKFTVIKDDCHRGLVMLKFSNMDDELRTYLTSLVE